MPVIVRVATGLTFVISLSAAVHPSEIDRWQAEYTRVMQDCLRLLGYCQGPTNGILNPQTTAATRRFIDEDDVRYRGRKPDPKYVCDKGAIIAQCRQAVFERWGLLGPSGEVNGIRLSQYCLQKLRRYDGPINGNADELPFVEALRG